MVRFSANPPSWKAGARQDVAVQDWLHAAGDLHAAIQAAVARFDFEVLRRRMQHVECLRLLLLEERRGASTGDQASAQAPASLLLPVAPEHLTPPVAPHNDPLRHVGEVASMRIAHLLGRLGRIPLLRQLGRPSGERVDTGAASPSRSGKTCRCMVRRAWAPSR